MFDDARIFPTHGAILFNLGSLAWYESERGVTTRQWVA